MPPPCTPGVMLPTARGCTWQPCSARCWGKGKSPEPRLSPLLGGDSVRQRRGDTLLPDCLALVGTARAAGGSQQLMGTLLGAAKWSAGVQAAPCPLLPQGHRGVGTWGARHTVHCCPCSTQEEEDLALAQALSASEAEYQQLQRQVSRLSLAVPPPPISASQGPCRDKEDVTLPCSLHALCPARDTAQSHPTAACHRHVGAVPVDMASCSWHKEQLWHCT